MQSIGTNEPEMIQNVHAWLKQLTSAVLRVHACMHMGIAFKYNNLTIIMMQVVK